MPKPTGRRTKPGVRRGGLVSEAIDGVVRRPTRSMLTGLGTLLGVGSFVAVLGLTSTANAQVSAAFSARDATQVVVEHVGAASARFTATAGEAALKVNGVRAVGVKADSDFSVFRSPEATAADQPAPFAVQGVDEGYWNVVRPELAEGRLFDSALQDQPVAVIGQKVADAFGISSLQPAPIVSLDGLELSVIGIVSHAERESGVVDASVSVPIDIVRRHEPQVRDAMIVVTDLGAAKSVAGELPTAIDPFAPDTLLATYTPRAHVVDDVVSQRLAALFVALAAVCLLVGAVGIANVTLISVMERVPEIGLRRALGAMPRHILGQFLLEAAIIGALGGFVGGVAGQLIVVTVSMLQDWTPVMDVRLVIASAPVGVALGVGAGAFPAVRAARMQPVDALRR